MMLRNRTLRAILAKGTLLLAALVWTAAGASALELAKVASVTGSAERGRGEPPQWSPLRSGEALHAGDVVRTGSDGRVELAWQGSTVRLYGDSVLRLPAPEGAVDKLDMRKGAGLFDVQRKPGRRYEVRTPEIVVSVKGTRFAVDLSGKGPGVAVYRGAVGVRSLVLQEVHEVMVREGFRALGTDGGPMELFLLREDDPWGAWSAPSATGPRVALRDQGFSHGRAVDRVREAARTTYRGEVLRRATQADPALAKRLAKIGDAKLATMAMAGEQMPAKLGEPRQRERRHNRDDVQDAIMDKGLEEVHDAMREEFVEAWVNGATSTGGATGGGTGSGHFEISIVTLPSGLEKIVVSQQQAMQQWSFNQNQLNNVVSGQTSFPTPLQNYLYMAGVTNEMQFAQMLLVMLASN